MTERQSAAAAIVDVSHQAVGQTVVMHQLWLVTSGTTAAAAVMEGKGIGISGVICFHLPRWSFA